MVVLFIIKLKISNKIKSITFTIIETDDWDKAPNLFHSDKSCYV